MRSRSGLGARPVIGLRRCVHARSGHAYGSPRPDPARGRHRRRHRGARGGPQAAHRGRARHPAGSRPAARRQAARR
ncbi:hypothetical protein JIW86_11775 [Streptomyces sp. NBC_00162]|nr:hypothetical protein JIW86_11775 [Streptomyces sp. NBC_00162]